MYYKTNKGQKPTTTSKIRFVKDSAFLLFWSAAGSLAKKRLRIFFSNGSNFEPRILFTNNRVSTLYSTVEESKCGSFRNNRVFFFLQARIYKLISALFLLCKGFVVNIWVISNQILALCLKSSYSYTVYCQNSKSSIGDVTAKRDLSLQGSITSEFDQ